jgi:anti-sigma regulatory factor (Ser/Thr protein kinase)
VQDAPAALEFELAPDLRAPRAARARLAALPRALDPRSTDDLHLLLSELVTNCVQHAGLDESDRITVQIRIDRGVVHGRVCHPAPRFAPPAPRLPGDGGWGLHLVEMLTRRWGVEGSDSETIVWFEMPRRQQEAPRPHEVRANGDA